MAGLLYQYLPGMSYIADDPAPAETLRDEVLGPLAGSWTLPSEWRPFRPEKFNDCRIIQSMFSTDPNRRKYYTEIVKLLLHESPISFKSLTYNSSLLKCLSIPCTFKKFDLANILLIFPTSLYPTLQRKALLPDVLLETLFRLSTSLSLSGAWGVVSGEDEDSSRRFGTLSCWMELDKY